MSSSSTESYHSNEESEGEGTPSPKKGSVASTRTQASSRRSQSSTGSTKSGVSTQGSRSQTQSIQSTQSIPKTPGRSKPPAEAPEKMKTGETVCGLKIEGKLGEGGYGNVYVVYYDGILRAAKRTKTGSKNYGFVDIMDIDIPLRVRHPNIIDGKKLIIEKSKKCDLSPGEYIMVLDLGTSFTKSLALTKLVYTDEHRIQHLTQILLGLEALHNSKILHLDLKIENIVIIGSPIDGDVKIIDFGFAYPVVNKNEIINTKRRVGTAEYLHPDTLREFITKDTYTYSYREDIYAFGVIAYISIFGHFPTFTNNFEALVEKVFRRDKNKQDVKQFEDFLNSYISFLNTTARKEAEYTMINIDPLIRESIIFCLQADKRRIPPVDYILNKFLKFSTLNILDPYLVETSIKYKDIKKNSFLEIQSVFIELSSVVQLNDIEKFSSIDIIYRTVDKFNFPTIYETYLYVCAVVSLIMNIRQEIPLEIFSNFILDKIYYNRKSKSYGKNIAHKHDLGDNDSNALILDWQRNIISECNGILLNYSNMNILIRVSITDLFNPDIYARYREYK